MLPKLLWARNIHLTIQNSIVQRVRFTNNYKNRGSSIHNCKDWFNTNSFPMLASRVSFIARSVARQPFMLQAASQRFMADTPDMKINATESHPVDVIVHFYS